jgi:hypothetical protein
MALRHRGIDLAALDRCDRKHPLEAKIRLFVGLFRVRSGCFTALLVQEVLPPGIWLLKPGLCQFNSTSYHCATCPTAIGQRALAQPREIEAGIFSVGSNVINDNSTRPAQLT